MRGMRRYVAVASAVAMVVTGLNQTIIKNNDKVRANEKPVKAVLLDDKDKNETYYKAVVNLFDYNAENTWEGYGVYGLKENYANQPSYWLKSCGVNKDIRETFTGDPTNRSMDNNLFLFGGERHKYKNQADYNEWTGEQGGLYQGLVKNSLSDGSLEFSDNIKCIDLFPSSSVEKSKNITPYYNREFFFQKSEDGYYTFDSDKDKICSSVSGGALQLEFDFAQKGPIFNTTTGTHNRDYGFFPLNSNDEGVKEYIEKRHHMFGMELTVDFNINSSRTVNGKDMEFTFSGDDDVWVFIDNKLVLDLGGIHNKATGSINFKTGEIKYNEDSHPIKTYKKSVVSDGVVSGASVSGTVTSTAPASLEEALGKELTKGKHTLKLFYLERGESDSNCMIQFNLAVEETVIPTPTVSIPVITTSTPKVEVTSTPKVEVTSTPKVEVTSTPKVEVTSTPKVEVTSTPKVEVTSTPKVEVTSTPKVEVSPTPKVEVTSTPKVKVTPIPGAEVTSTPKVEATSTPEVIATPKIEVTAPVSTEVVVTEEPIPEATVQPTATPLVAEETMVPNIPKPTENPIVITEGPVPEGVVSTSIPTVMPSADTTFEPNVNETERPYATAVVTDKIDIAEETEKPAGPVVNEDEKDKDDDDAQSKEDKKKTTIVIDDATPGELPKTGGIADLMENGKAASYTVIVFLLGSAIVFSIGRIKGKKVKR